MGVLFYTAICIIATLMFVRPGRGCFEYLLAFAITITFTPIGAYLIFKFLLKR